MTADLDVEFAYTPWRNACRDPFSPVQCCRRPTGHDGPHACGFGAGRQLW